ncbi:MAG: hypothetical protein Hyperionvirus49_1, partial [Hyperionvirus sp.]
MGEEKLDALFGKALEGNLEANYEVRDYYNRHEHLGEIYEFFKKRAGGNDFAGYHYAKFFGTKNDFCEFDEVRENKMFRGLAERGNSFGQFVMGNLSRKDAKLDTKVALDYYKLAAAQNNRLAQCVLGSIYYQGGLVKKDDGEAYKWAFEAAKNGEHAAKMLLSKIYIDDVRSELKIDGDLVFKWIMELPVLCDGAVVQLWEHLERDWKKNPDIIEKIYNCLNAGVKTNKKASVLAIMCLRDEYGKKSYEKAIEMIDYLKGVKSVRHLCRVGSSCYDSKDVRVLEIIVDSLEYCVRVHPKNNQAMNTLGCLYDKENELKNHGAAMYWFQKGAALGCGHSLYNVGVYFESRLVEKNLEMAFDYFKRAALLGLKNAVKKVAEMYQKGKGVEVNLV